MSEKDFGLIYCVLHQCGVWTIWLNTKDAWSRGDLDDFNFIIEKIYRHQLNTDGVMSYVVSGCKTIYRLHRLINNCPKNRMVDHINGKGLDNRKCNLRIVSRRKNGQNRKLNVDNTSGTKGVFYREKKKKDKIYRYWYSIIVDNDGKRIESPYYSFTKYGEEVAKQKAIEWRSNKENEYGYLNTH